jgi:hypothetical protein
MSDPRCGLAGQQAQQQQPLQSVPSLETLTQSASPPVLSGPELARGEEIAAVGERRSVRFTTDTQASDGAHYISIFISICMSP